MELARYRTKALNALKAGKRAPRFESAILPPGLHRVLETQLAAARTADDARRIFASQSEAMRMPAASAAADMSCCHAGQPCTDACGCGQDCACRQQNASSGGAGDVNLTPSEHTGLMIALMLAPEAAQALHRALPASLRSASGAERPGDYHITLTYHGDTADDGYSPAILATLQRAVAQFVNAWTGSDTLTGHISGVGNFTPQGPQAGAPTYPLYASVDVPGIQRLRAGLCAVLAEHHLPDAFVAHQDFEFTPHITLAYLPVGTPPPLTTLPAIPLRFSAITLAQGSHRYAYSLAGGAAEIRSEGHGASAESADPWAAALTELREQRALVLAALGR